jgi:hypothetical protein
MVGSVFGRRQQTVTLYRGRIVTGEEKMARSTTGYSKSLTRIRTKLKKMGLPESMFDADFEEKEARNKERTEVLLERMREREKSGAYEGLELPWTELRQQYEKDALGCTVEEYTATQAVVPHWKKSLDITAYVWKTQIEQLIEREAKKKKK